jgi:hypothetical protein
MIEPTAVQIDHHEVLIDQVLDAAVDLPAEFLPVERHAAQFVRDLGLNDVERRLAPFGGLDGCRR